MKDRYFLVAIGCVLAFLVLVYPVFGVLSDTLESMGGTDAQKSAVIAVAIIGSMVIVGFIVLLYSVRNPRR
jgi:type IV secretory pathway VirB2 component (pilin)